MWMSLIFLVLGSLPLVDDYVKHIGVGSLLLGIAGGLSSFVRSGRNSKGKIPLGVLAPLASILFLYGLVVASYALSLWYFECGSAWSMWVLGGFVALSLVTGCFANLNYISIHKYYRDRLMEAFMPQPDTDGKPTAAREANKAKLSDLCSEHAPYHLLNTNVVLVDSDDPKWRVRGGDAFLLSPKYCGSSATAWAPTAEYMKKDPLTLATAVAISGAAANPNTAAGGSGPTRNSALSLLSVCQKTPLSELSCHDPPHFPRQLQPNFVQEDASDRSGWGDWWWTGPDLRNAAIGRRSRLLGSGFKG